MGPCVAKNSEAWYKLCHYNPITITFKTCSDPTYIFKMVQILRYVPIINLWNRTSSLPLNSLPGRGKFAFFGRVGWKGEGRMYPNECIGRILPPFLKSPRHLLSGPPEPWKQELYEPNGRNKRILLWLPCLPTHYTGLS